MNSIPYSGGSSNSRFHLIHISFPGVPSSLNYIIAKLHLNHRKASTLFFYPSFRVIILLLPEFFMEVLHDGSSRIYFLLEAFIKILFRGAQVFFFMQSGVQFLLPYLFRWCYVILTISFVFHDSQVVRNEIVKPINFFEHELFSIHQSLRWSILV